MRYIISNRDQQGNKGQHNSIERGSVLFYEHGAAASDREKDANDERKSIEVRK